MSIPARGKRKMAWMAATFGVLLTVFISGAIVWGELQEAEIKALEGIFATMAVTIPGLVLVLLGIDAVPSQIIPALKKGDE